MKTLLRTTSLHPDFIRLVSALDQELAVRDGDDHAFYNQYNATASLQHCVVALLDSVAVGCGALRPYDEHTMEIKRMFVPLEFRGMGIASQILHELEYWAGELNYARCILETGKNQPEAIGLYSKNNYIIIPNYGPYKNISNSVCFEKIILPQ